MTDRCNNCGDPRAAQTLFDDHDTGCDCDTCLGACWAEFGHPCEAPDVAELRAEVERLQAVVRQAGLAAFMRDRDPEEVGAHLRGVIASYTDEIDRLRALVKRAYGEGFIDGNAYGADDGNWSCDEDAGWLNSDVRAALDADRNSNNNNNNPLEGE